MPHTVTMSSTLCCSIWPLDQQHNPYCGFLLTLPAFDQLLLLLPAARTCSAVEAHPHWVELQRNARLRLSSSQQAELQQQQQSASRRHAQQEYCTELAGRDTQARVNAAAACCICACRHQQGSCKGCKHTTQMMLAGHKRAFRARPAHSWWQAAPPASQ